MRILKRETGRGAHHKGVCLVLKGARELVTSSFTVEICVNINAILPTVLLIIVGLLPTVSCSLVETV